MLSRDGSFFPLLFLQPTVFNSLREESSNEIPLAAPEPSRACEEVPTPWLRPIGVDGRVPPGTDVALLPASGDPPGVGNGLSGNNSDVKRRTNLKLSSAKFVENI